MKPYSSKEKWTMNQFQIYSLLLGYYLLNGSLRKKSLNGYYINFTYLRWPQLICDNLNAIFSESPIKIVNGKIRFSRTGLSDIFPMDKNVLQDWQNETINNNLKEFIQGIFLSSGFYKNGKYILKLKNLNLQNLLENCLSQQGIEYTIELELNNINIVITEEKSCLFLDSILPVILTTSQHSEESKAKISAKRKQWLEMNPDLHPWKKLNKFKSKPCENVKKFLLENNIEFLPEYPCGIPERYFSIDIALPDKKIAIEINGRQHYDEYGNLKPYYQERHDLLISSSWQVFEIYYTHCFDFSKWSEFISFLKNQESIEDFDYFGYKVLPTKLSQRALKQKCPECGGLKHFSSPVCKKCYVRPTKITWPTVEEMTKLVFEMPSTKLAEKLGVSDRAIKDFCDKNNIAKPPRGYWRKLKCGKL